MRETRKGLWGVIALATGVIVALPVADQGAEPVWKNQMPAAIIRVFEKHGFIWGGYWYHFDTMHFEYRPELLAGKR